MQSEIDCETLQNDIDRLEIWCRTNQMRFHPDKCKVVSIASNGNRLSYLRLLPFSHFSYALDYEKNEIDLGVIISDQFTWSDQHLKIITKASQMLGLIKRTCHFLIHS